MDIESEIKIQNFLDNLEVINSDLFEIIKNLRSLILNQYPQIEERIMYGGIMFFNESEMLCGLFAYTKHVSLELSNGSQMNDHYKLLEGNGKFRRHIKAFSMTDIEKEKIEYYLSQLK